MTKLNCWILLTAIFCVINGCDQMESPSEEPPLTSQEFWNCHQDANWDAASLRDALLGDWNWVYSVNYWAPTQGRRTDSTRTVIQLRADSTLHVRVAGELQQASRWDLLVIDDPLYGLEVEPANSLTYGRILLCNDFLQFNDSYIDGVDNYFERVR